MNHARIEEQQAYAIKKIYEVGDKVDFVPQNILEIILKKINFHKDFGILGNNLYSFLKDIDTKHPDLNNTFNGFFSKDNESYKMLQDVINVHNFIKENNISDYIFDIIKEKICNEKNNLLKELKEIKEKAKSPLINQQNIRLLKNSIDRKKIRSTKKFQEINNFSKEIFSEEVPKDFYFYIRNEKIYEKQIKDLLRKKNIFKKNNLTKISKEISKEINLIKFNVKNNKNFGFNEISVNSATKILFNMCSFKKDNQDIITTSELGDENITKFNLYNWHEVSKNSSKKIKDLINYLEKFPELNEKPLFDHYRVLIPFFKNNDKNYYFKYMDKKGKILEYENTEKSKKLLSLKLISKKETVGVLLGERDGVHYFISYFM